MENNKAVTVRPEHPVGTFEDCRSLFSMYERELAGSLPKHVSISLLLKAALNSVRRTPKLLECTKGSMLSALVFCAESNLIPDTPLQECHLLPFKVKGVMTVVWVSGYRGLLKLVRQSGDIVYVDSFAVYSKDTFNYRLGLDRKLDHIPYDGADDPGDPIYFYAIAYYRNRDVPPQFDVMSKAQVDAIRAKSKAKDGDAWVYHYVEMGRKTIIRRLAKRLPQSPELAKALELDNDLDVGRIQVPSDTLAGVIDVEPTAEESATETLAKKVEKKANGDSQGTPDAKADSGPEGGPPDKPESAEANPDNTIKDLIALGVENLVKKATNEMAEIFKDNIDAGNAFLVDCLAKNIIKDEILSNNNAGQLAQFIVKMRQQKPSGKAGEQVKAGF